MSFEELLVSAKAGDEAALTELLERYKPMLYHNAMIDGRMDEDLYQELCVTLWKCVQMFKI